MKTPLLLLGICASLYGSAQTINLSDTLSTGDAMTYFVLDSNAVNLSGISGADAVWDYSDISGYAIAPNDNNIIDRETSPFAASFPDADYAESFENSVNTFFSNDPGSDEVIVYGFVFQELTSDFIIKYDTDPLISMQFPMELADSYTDDISGTATVPLAGDVSITGSATITADGTGTLKLGGTDYTDVIRVHTIEISNGVILGSPATITRDSYVYYQIGSFNMPIFIHASVLAELGAGGDFGFTAVYSKDEITDYTGIEESTSPLTLSVYPNPANGGVATIETAEATSKLSIVNTLGQVVTEINNPATIETIDLVDYKRGVYFIQAVKDGVMKTEKFVVR